MTQKEEALKRKLLRRYEEGIKKLPKLRSELLPDHHDPEMAKFKEHLLKTYEGLTNLMKKGAQSIK